VETKPSPEIAAISKEHYNQGTRHFQLGHYQDALAEYEAGYMMVPDPAFLYKHRQCHRKMGHDKEAIGFYKSYCAPPPIRQPGRRAEADSGAGGGKHN